MDGEHRETGLPKELTGHIVDAGLTVHRALGPGLLESAYEQCLTYELENRGYVVDRQVGLPINFGGHRVETAYRLDLLVDRSVIVEVKAVDMLNKLHEAQILTYLKLSGCRVGLLMNFNVVLFKSGLKRFIR